MIPDVVGPQRILIVEDDAPSRQLLERILVGHPLSFAADGVEAWDLLQSDPPPDLILLDVMLPRMNGFEVCRRLKADPVLRDIPVIFSTGLGEGVYEAEAFALGAVDYVTKPFDPPIVAARVRTRLALTRATQQLAGLNVILEQKVAACTGQLEAALKLCAEAALETVVCLCRAAEYRDHGSWAHVRRMSGYAAAIARQLRLATPEVENLREAAAMHDVGKIGIPDHILLKQGQLDAAEWQIMKQHTTIGARMLAGSASEVIRLGQVVALTHHEKWDGSGYPRGLRGTEIPMAGRIVAVADTFDALASKRPYKEASPLPQCFEVIQRAANSSFDPEIVEAFGAVEDEITQIRTSQAKEP